MTNKQGDAEGVNGDIIVVGGGIAGLAAAHHLQRLGATGNITLLERDERLGGKIITEQIDGYLIEGGPDSFLSRKPRGTGLCIELGIADQLRGRRPDYARTYVKQGAELYRLPAGLSGMIPTDLGTLEETPLLSAEGKDRLAREVTQPPRTESGDESLADFVTRRMGRETYERLVEPLMGGIYAGDAEQLSLEATFPQLKRIELEHGSLLQGLRSVQDNGRPSSPYPPFVSFDGGMIDLVRELVAQMTAASVVTGVDIDSVQRDGSLYRLQDKNGNDYDADAVILAVPAYATAQVLADLDPVLAEAHGAIPYASSAIVTLTYDLSEIDHPLEGYGYVIPRTEATDILACTWTSRKWAHRAPAGHVLMRLYIGRYGKNILKRDDRALTLLAREELRATLGIDVRPAFAKVYRWPRAMPQYTMGHLDRLNTIDERLSQHPGLFVAGAAYRGIGIPDCILSGEIAAEAAAAYLGVANFD